MLVRGGETRPDGFWWSWRCSGWRSRSWLGPRGRAADLRVGGGRGGLPRRWVWPAVLAAAAVCATVVGVDALGDLFVLPLVCLLTAFALQGTRHLISLDPELLEARDELARNAVARSGCASPGTCTTCSATACR